MNVLSLLPSLEEVDVVELVELQGNLDRGLEFPAHLGQGRGLAQVILRSSCPEI